MQIVMPARHRTVRSNGSLSTDCAGHDLQTRQSRRKSWRRLDGHNQLPKVILGVEFADGIEVIGPHMCIAGARHHIRVRPVLRIEERTD
jgi:putative transposase